MSVAVNLVGKVFGLLTVVGRADNSASGHPRWHCSCACGKSPVVIAQSLRDGRSRSCGCDSARLAKATPRPIKHGQSKSVEYHVWSTMKRRCLSPDHDSYSDYGARGITVAPEWIDDFNAFLNYVGPRPTPKHSIDRYPNNNGNYEPGNVRWALPIEQQNNKRNNFMVDLADGSRPLQEVARSEGINANNLRSRLKRGASPEQAIQALKQERAI